MNDYYDTQLKEESLSLLTEEDNFIFHKLDLKNKESTENIFKGHSPGHVVNLAAQVGARHSIESPHAYVDTNLIGFMNVLEACKNYPGKHLFYASSSSVYGGNKGAPYSANHNVDYPISLYIDTKKSNENVSLAPWNFGYIVLLQISPDS